MMIFVTEIIKSNTWFKNVQEYKVLYYLHNYH